MNLDFSKFKKVKEDKASAILQHPDGHHIRIAKGPLSLKMQEQLSKLPMNMADGGVVEDDYTKDAQDPSQKSNQPTIIINNGPQQPQMGAENLGALVDAGVNASRPGTDAEVLAQRVGLNPQFAPALRMAEGALEGDPYAAQRILAFRASNMAAQENQMKAVDQQADQQGRKAQRAQAFQQFVGSPQATAPQIVPAQLNPDQNPNPSLNQNPGIAPAPMQQAPTDSFGTNEYEKNVRGGLESQLQGIQKQAEAEGALGKQRANILDVAEQRQQKLFDDYQMNTNALMKERDAFLNDYRNKRIDPQHYMNSMGVGQRIATAIGLIIGGAGAGITHTENPVMKFLNQQIDNDIQSQAANMTKSQNLLKANMEQFGNLRMATDMTKAMQLGIVQNQLEEAAAKATDPLAKSRALQAAGQLKLQQAPLLAQVAMRKTMMSQMQGGQQQGGVDKTGQLIDMLRMTNPDLAKSYEARYIPKVGLASIPVPDKAREEITSRQTLDEAVSKLREFAKKNEGTVLDLGVVTEGKAMVKLVQDLYRRVNGQGVFKESESDFVKGITGDDPTAFFSLIRTLPKYKALLDANSHELNNLKGSYGLPTRYTPPGAKDYNPGARGPAVAERK